MTVRDGWHPMQPQDLPCVGPIADAVHHNLHEPHEVYANRLALYPAGCLAYWRDGEMAGYLIAHPWTTDDPPPLGAIIGELPPAPDCYYLHDIALLPTARAYGAGRAGFDRCLTMARLEGLRSIELVAVNGADRYWRRLGFARVANEAAEAYGDGSCLMRRGVDLD